MLPGAGVVSISISISNSMPIPHYLFRISSRAARVSFMSVPLPTAATVVKSSTLLPSSCARCLVPINDHDATTCPVKFHISAHAVMSRSLQTEVDRVIGGSIPAKDITIVCTLQHSAEELVAIGDHIEAEKDKLLLSFFDYAKEFCDKIAKAGFWADYVDPCSGLLMNSPFTNVVYNEVQFAEVLLNFRVMNAGCCKILLHPEWGSSVYPATMFCNAPKEIVVDILRSLHDHTVFAKVETAAASAAVRNAAYNGNEQHSSDRESSGARS